MPLAFWSELLITNTLAMQWWVKWVENNICIVLFLNCLAQVSRPLTGCLVHITAYSCKAYL